VDQQLARADGFGAGLKASMLHDLERGSRLEVEWLNGAVARLGRELGVSTPVNRCIAVALRPYADGTAPSPSGTFRLTREPG
jgi:2-dehydropantoate 2-reductase